MDVLTGEIRRELNHIALYPASHYVVPMERILEASKAIEKEMEEQVAYFKSEDKLLEAQRISERTNFDLEMMKETGFCSGIENYSRHLAGLKPGEPPYTLMDYFGDDYLIMIDESHITVPQVRGMYFGDQSRKSTLVDYGFRLPSAKDNRPLNFEEFETPLLINPYLSSGGDVRCVIAQVALLVILFIIYYPFAKIWEARMIEEEKA